MNESTGGISQIELMMIMVLIPILGIFPMAMFLGGPKNCQTDLIQDIYEQPYAFSNIRDISDSFKYKGCNLGENGLNLTTSLVADLNRYEQILDNKKLINSNKSLFISNLLKQKEEYEAGLETKVNQFIADAKNSGDIVGFVYSNQFLVETLVNEGLFDSVKDPLISDAVYQTLVSFIKYAIFFGLIGLVLFLIKLYISYLIFNQIKYRKLFNYPLRNSFIRKQFGIKDETDYEMYNLFVEMFLITDFSFSKKDTEASFIFNGNKIVSLTDIIYENEKISNFNMKIENLEKNSYPKFLFKLILEKINSDFVKIKKLREIDEEKNHNIKVRTEKIEIIEQKTSFLNFIKNKESSLPQNIKDSILISKDLQDITDEYNAVSKKAEFILKHKKKGV